jgi:hypothetical protein
MKIKLSHDLKHFKFNIMYKCYDAQVLKIECVLLLYILNEFLYAYQK